MIETPRVHYHNTEAARDRFVLCGSETVDLFGRSAYTSDPARITCEACLKLLEIGGSFMLEAEGRRKIAGYAAGELLGPQELYLVVPCAFNDSGNEDMGVQARAEDTYYKDVRFRIRDARGRSAILEYSHYENQGLVMPGEEHTIIVLRGVGEYIAKVSPEALDSFITEVLGAALVAVPHEEVKT